MNHGIIKKIKAGLGVVAAGAVTVVASSTSSFAAFTLPAMPTDDIETAGAAVAGLVISSVLIGAVLRMVRKAG